MRTDNSFLNNKPYLVVSVLIVRKYFRSLHPTLELDANIEMTNPHHAKRRRSLDFHIILNCQYTEYISFIFESL